MRSRIPAHVLLAAALLGAACGAFQLYNTSLGWHLASGRFVLEHGQPPRQDPFSFTSGGVAWTDHEWLFQLLLAAVEKGGGAPALVVLRMLLLAVLALLLLAIGVESGLAPPAALLLASLCLWGARMRFFLRPELVTLLVVPAALWLVLGARRRWPIALAVLVLVGANCHAGALILPPLLAAVVVGMGLRPAASLSERWRNARPALAGLALASAVPILNPYGWRLYQVPLHVARLVGLPHIPNPEWISPSPAQVPALYVALALALVLFVLRERDPVRWLLLLMTAALALRYVRNVGLFFVVLPLLVAPALARLPLLGAEAERRRWVPAAVLGAVALIAVSALVAPWPPFGFGYSDSAYPIAACDFLEREHLLGRPLYNDVRFGGYLIGRYYPPQQVFLDDRNEVNEPLLREIFALLGSSDVVGWERLLGRFRIDLALLRYYPPTRVVVPGQGGQGSRGFSTLWFPPSRWALVYWDEVAMVLVRRQGADAALLARCEYQLVRPDDADNLKLVLAARPELRRPVVAELLRSLEGRPSNWRAVELVDYLNTLAAGGAAPR